MVLTKTASISDSSNFLIFGCQRYSGASQNSWNIGFPELFPVLELVDVNEKFLYFSRKSGNAALNSAGAAGWGPRGCGPVKCMLNTRTRTMTRRKPTRWPFSFPNERNERLVRNAERRMHMTWMCFVWSPTSGDASCGRLCNIALCLETRCRLCRLEPCLPRLWFRF
jgi:hypothetical protein